MPSTFMTRPDGSRVREIRRAKEWTQDDLARRARLSRPYISAIENGQSVSKIVMRRVAKVLKVGYGAITLPREDGAEQDAAQDRDESEARPEQQASAA